MPLPKVEFKRQVPYINAMDCTKFLQGRVLTIIESAGMPDSQEKAIKDLIRGEFDKTIDVYWQHCNGHDVWPSPPRAAK